MSDMITTRDKVVCDLVEQLQRQREKDRQRQQQQRVIRVTWDMLKEKRFGYSVEGRSPVILDYEEGRFLYDVMPDGAWKGQRCFVIGGGPSLEGFDFSQLKNELVIGVNRVYEQMDCTIMFAMDSDLYGWIINGRLGKEAKRKFEDFKGFPVWLDSAGYDYPKGIFVLGKSNSHIVSQSMKNGISGETNSGFGALSLAICLGANPIYLLGFDMKGREGKPANWHNGYPKTQASDKIYRVFINDFNRVAKDIAKRGFQVINLNPNSELKCFEFGRFKDINLGLSPVITSYYTKDTAYEDQVEHLRVTLKRFNLDNDVVGIPDQGNWHKNTYYKPNFIMKMLKKYPGRPIVFIDADARIRENPVLFNDLDCDFACFFLHNKELLSGTLYFGNTKGSHYIVNKWLEENKKSPHTHMPQKNLRTVFDKVKHKINWMRLPVEYCMIFDSNIRTKINPVIEHFQLSRVNKNPDKKPGGLDGYNMRRSLVGIQKFCKAKRICILGNADSVLRKKRDVDSFDIVGRMNRGNPRGKEAFIGSRTDILFLSTSMSRKKIHLSFSDPQYVVWMTACHRLAHPWVLRSAIQNPQEDWHELQKELDINPTTGLMTLNFLLKHIDFKSLTIYGFDFFATKTWYNTKIDDGQKHSGVKERAMIMNMIKGRKNVKLLS